MELKVFTLPTCSVCPIAKKMAFEVAEKYNTTCRIVNLATKEGLKEGTTYQIISVPTITIDNDIVVRGHLITTQKLEEEVEKRLDKWKTRASEQKHTN